MTWEVRSGECAKFQSFVSAARTGHRPHAMLPCVPQSLLGGWRTWRPTQFQHDQRQGHRTGGREPEIAERRPRPYKEAPQSEKNKENKGKEQTDKRKTPRTQKHLRKNNQKTKQLEQVHNAVKNMFTETHGTREEAARRHVPRVALSPDIAQRATSTGPLSGSGLKLTLRKRWHDALLHPEETQPTKGTSLWRLPLFLPPKSDRTNGHKRRRNPTCGRHHKHRHTHQ